MDNILYTITGLAIAAAISLGVMWNREHNALVTLRADYTQAAADQKAAAIKANQTFEQWKEEADAQRQSLLTANGDLSNSLFNARSRTSYVPKPSTTTNNPQRACFNRDELDSALRQLDASIQGLITEGDHAIIGLDTAKTWASH